MGQYVDRINEIKEILEDDERGLGLLESLVEEVREYFRYVVTHERHQKIQKFTKEEDEYLDELERLAERRQEKHNSLIASLNGMNRYLRANYDEKTPKGGPFVGDLHRYKERDEIGEWAGNLTRDLIEMEREKAAEKKESEVDRGMSLPMR